MSAFLKGTFRKSFELILSMCRIRLTAKLGVAAPRAHIAFAHEMFEYTFQKGGGHTLPPEAAHFLVASLAMPIELKVR